MIAQALRITQTTIGKKVVMAASGLILTGFVLVHMLGNLQIYLGREQLNAYAKALHEMPALVWAARIVLLLAVGAHLVSALLLVKQNMQARPRHYLRKDHVAATYASRTMRYGGLLLVFFIVYHLLHLTTGTVHAKFVEHDVYSNMVVAFQNPAVCLFYGLANVLLAFHLSHGVWSLFQTLGLNNRRFDTKLRLLARLVAAVILVGNLSFPITIYFGLIS
jgi:succinate dehydrogenase / fumarate reductase cytochrome b subunit